jgi:hypothetical protein
MCKMTGSQTAFLFRYIPDLNKLKKATGSPFIDTTLDIEFTQPAVSVIVRVTV